MSIRKVKKLYKLTYGIKRVHVLIFYNSKRNRTTVKFLKNKLIT